MRSLRYLEFRGEDVKLMEIVQDKTWSAFMLILSSVHRSWVHQTWINDQWWFTWPHSYSISDLHKRSRSYLIRGLRDNVPGVAYRSQAKGWMHRKLFQEWLGEDRILSRERGYTRHIFLDNCTSHGSTEEADSILESKKTLLSTQNRYTSVATSWQFIMEVIKDYWKTKWMQEKRLWFKKTV